MALWDERIGSHGAWDEVETARSRFAELTAEHPGHEALVRPVHLVEMLAARLRAIDPQVATEPLLGGIESKVQALRQQVVQVFEPAEGQEAATLEHVNAAAENLAQHITTLPPAGSAELVGITDEFRSELDGLRGQVQSIVDQAQVSVGESTDAHTATLEEAKAEAAQLATRLTETDSAIEELKTKVDEFIATREQEATTATNSAKSQFDSQLNSAKERLEQVVLDAANRFEEEEQREKASHAELIEQQSEAGAEHIARIEDLKEQAERLVGAVGRTGLSGGFQQ